jgi:hypothetical protein
MTARVLLLAALIAVSLALAGWYQASGQLRQSRLGELKPLAALLGEDQQVLQALQGDSALEKQSGILASYLAKIRADGVAKHADMKQRLDRLAENNSAIIALIDVYTPHARSAAFSAESERFVRYAIAWRDRWNAVMELFMAGGNYPVAGVPFPTGFPTAVDAEIAAAK